MKKQLLLFGLSASLIFQSIATPVYALEAEPLKETALILEENNSEIKMEETIPSDSTQALEENTTETKIQEETQIPTTTSESEEETSSESPLKTEPEENRQDITETSEETATETFSIDSVVQNMQGANIAIDIESFDGDEIEENPIENETEEIMEGQVDGSHIIQNGSFNPIVDEIATFSTQSFSLTNSQEKAILSALSNRASEINVSKYKIPEDKVGRIVIDLINSHPELYFVQSGFRYFYNTSGYIVSIKPIYYNGLGYAKDKAAFKAAAQKAIAKTKGIKNDFEKALVIHDYLVLHGEYDTSVLNSKDYDHICHSAYGALVNQVAVCQGYALAYKYLLNQVGIDCYMVTSERMNHAWNMVKLNGSYYHVDVTWDDPLSDQFGYAQHNYFLLSDSAISDHYDWVISEGGEALNCAANSSTYQNYAWIGIRSGILPYKNNWYYIDHIQNAIVKNSNLASENTETNFYSLNSYWSSSASLALYENIFYFPASDGIYQLSADDASICTKLTSGNSISGCVVDDNILQYKENGSIRTYTLSDKITVPDTEPDEEDKADEPTEDDSTDTPSEEEGTDTPIDDNEAEPEIKYNISLTDTNFTYTGTAIKPDVIISDGIRQLAEGTDYSISYKNNINAGTAQIIIKGKNGYSIDKILTFDIAKCDLADTSITANPLYYTKATKNPVPVITKNGKKLSNGKDFILTYENGGIYSKAGNYELLVTGIGNYTGTLKVKLSILDPKTMKLISKAKVSNVKNFNYGENYEQKPIVKFGKEILIENKDYTVYYPENPQAGTATMVITGIGEYAGEKRVKYKIIGSNINKATVSGLEETVTYTGSAITMENCSLKMPDGTILKKDIDYTVSYTKNISAGKATIIFTGINGYSGVLKKKFTIKACSLTDTQIKLNKTYTYVASGVKPRVRISFGEMLLREKVDYKLSYKNNKKCGTATVTITGKGNFAGKIDKTFTIVKK